MMSFSLILGAAACFALLAFRYKAAPKDQRNQSTPKQRLKFAKVLFAALLALLAIHYKLADAGRTLNGGKSHTPSWFEKFVLDQSN